MNDRILCTLMPRLAGCLLACASASAQAQSLPAETCNNPVLPATTPSTEFIVVDDGSVIRHEVTGLEWQRCSIGQSWDGTMCQGSATFHSWQEALNIAANAGGDWRLPNIKELRTIVERCRENPAINRQAFPNTPSRTFWSASPEAGGSAFAWFVNFRDGRGDLGSRGSRWVRLVRGGP